MTCFIHMKTEEFKGKVAYITGGTKGIGKGIAQALLNMGMKVAFTSRSQESADKAVQELDGKKENILALESKVQSLQSEENATRKVMDKWGRIDVAVANAGVGNFVNIAEMTEQQWHDTIDVNVTGVFNTTKACLPHLKSSKGYLFTIASLAGTNFFAGGAAYNASKFAVVGFSQAVMLDVRHDDVKVTTIMPGSVKTYFNDNEPGAKDNWKIQPEDIGQMVVDLLKMNPRTLPSKVEVRPSKPPIK